MTTARHYIIDIQSCLSKPLKGAPAQATKKFHKSARIIETDIPSLYTIEPEPARYWIGKEQVRDRLCVTQTKHALRILLCYAIELTQAIFCVQPLQKDEPN